MPNHLPAIQMNFPNPQKILWGIPSGFHFHSEGGSLANLISNSALIQELQKKPSSAMLMRHQIGRQVKKRLGNIVHPAATGHPTQSTRSIHRWVTQSRRARTACSAAPPSQRATREWATKRHLTAYRVTASPTLPNRRRASRGENRRYPCFVSGIVDAGLFLKHKRRDAESAASPRRPNSSGDVDGRLTRLVISLSRMEG